MKICTYLIPFLIAYELESHRIRGDSGFLEATVDFILKKEEVGSKTSKIQARALYVLELGRKSSVRNLGPLMNKRNEKN